MQTNQEWDDQKANLKANVVALTSQTGAAVLTCEEDAAKVTDMIGLCNAMLKSIEDQRVAFTKPINEIVKGINEDAKALKAPLEAAKSRLQPMLDKWLIAKKRAAEEAAAAERRRLEDRRLEQAALLEQVGFSEEAEKVLDKTAQAVAVGAAPRGAQQRGGMGNTASLATSWQFEVEDITKVPPRFLLLDGIQVRQFMREQVELIETEADERGLRGREREAFIAAKKKQNYAIPGVRFTLVESGRVR